MGTPVPPWLITKWDVGESWTLMGKQEVQGRSHVTEAPQANRIPLP